ncbi:MAG: hypothetical protein JWP89_5649 [Schlesneria sp.]|nr:hypothetical protein [Schlesneria sp.]
MTENEFLSVPRARNVPIYDEGDVENCEALERPEPPQLYSGEILDIRETDEYEGALKDPNFVLKGAERSQEGDIAAIFWKKRQD